MSYKMIKTITITFDANKRLEELAHISGKSMSQYIEDLIVADYDKKFPQPMTIEEELARR